MLRIGKFIFSSSVCWLLESTLAFLSFFGFLFSAFTKDTVYVVKTASFVPTGKHVKGKQGMRWVEGTYSTWMEGGRLEAVMTSAG